MCNYSFSILNANTRASFLRKTCPGRRLRQRQTTQLLTSLWEIATLWSKLRFFQNLNNACKLSKRDVLKSLRVFPGTSQPSNMLPLSIAVKIVSCSLLLAFSVKLDLTHSTSFCTCLQKMILNLHSYDGDNPHFKEKSICLKAGAKSQPFPQPSRTDRLLLRAFTWSPFNPAFPFSQPGLPGPAGC